MGINLGHSGCNTRYASRNLMQMRYKKYVSGAKSKSNPRLIIIDTLGKIRGSRTENDTAYESDYRAVSELQELAGEIGLAVLLVHHVRKMEADDPIDTVSGTLGLTGAADTVLVLSRKSDGVTLYGRGRDIAEVETAMSFSKENYRWSILGAPADVRRSDERKWILERLQTANVPFTPQKMAELAGFSHDAARQMLIRMAAAGEVKKLKRGSYAHNDYVEPSHNSHNVTTQV